MVSRVQHGPDDGVPTPILHHGFGPEVTEELGGLVGCEPAWRESEPHQGSIGGKRQRLSDVLRQGQLVAALMLDRSTHSLEAIPRLQAPDRCTAVDRRELVAAPSAAGCTQSSTYQGMCFPSKSRCNLAG